MAVVKSEIKHRMTRRLFDWDYRQRAIYMITLTLADRSREWLGRLILAENGKAQDGAKPSAALPNGAQSTSLQGSAVAHCASGKHGAEIVQDNSGLQGSFSGTWGAEVAQGNSGMQGAFHGTRYPVVAQSCATISPTPFGLAVLEALAEMPRLYPQVKIIESQLMPEHLHFVIFVQQPLEKPLGALIRGFKAGATKRWRLISGESPVWAEGFQDTILLRDGQLQAMLDYVRDNPRRLAEKRANPELFRRVALLELPLNGGRIIGRFEALGNRHLLDRPMVQVQCSRRYLSYRRIAKAGGGLKIAKDAIGEPIVERSTQEYEERLESTLVAAKHGAVVLSPCISDGEKQIAREVLKRNLPLVVLKNMGFSKYEKPGGRYFEACAEGRLLMLAPAAWPYSTQAKAMTRFDATALNRIAQWLAGEDAVEINYHGMQPENIDGLAEEALRSAW